MITAGEFFILGVMLDNEGVPFWALQPPATASSVVQSESGTLQIFGEDLTVLNEPMFVIGQIWTPAS